MRSQRKMLGRRKDDLTKGERDMRKNIRGRVLSLIASLVLAIVTIPAIVPAQEASAASKYIKVDAFIKYLVTEMKLPVDQSSKTPYIDAAKRVGILKDGDFKKYSVYLTRTDCAVLANRADEYIYGSHYGFTDGVYEFLKDCEYYDGLLYYNVNSDLYPDGQTPSTYSASQFLNEVVMKNLEPSFKFPKGLSAEFFDDTRYTEKSYGTYIRIGLRIDSDINSSPVSFKEDDYLIQAWKKIIDGDRRVRAVYDLRISDLNKIAKSKRQDVAEIVAKGIIKGYSNGMYVQNRTFKGSSKITAAGAKGVVKLVLDQYSRAKISPDGQLIRTTNLPKNYYDFPYILECFPNDFYEMPFYFTRISSYKKGNMARSTYEFPSNIGNEGIIKEYEGYINIGMKPYYYFDTIKKQVNTYLEHIFNVSYSSVGTEWSKGLMSSYAPINGYSISDNIDHYISAVKKNHVMVESQLISLEPSSLYYYLNNYYIRAYVKYRITADTIIVDDDKDLLFSAVNTYLVGLKNGEWTYGYYDIMISGYKENNKQDAVFGVASWAGISDGAYRGEK
jgi:hypothetical protein